MKINNYNGVYSIPVTPFNEDLSIDFVSLRKCIEYFIEKNRWDSSSVNVSEASKLSDFEKNEILAETVKVTEGKIPLIAGVTGNSIHHVIERSKYTRTVRNIFCNGNASIGYSSDTDFYNFYEEISKQINCDIWVQNNKMPAGPSVPTRL